MGIERVVHLEKANTLSKFITKEEWERIVSLKITGFIGQKDFDDVLDFMCDAYGEYDEADNFVPDLDMTPALRHLDLGEAIYVDGDGMPYFGYRAQLETFVLPRGITTVGYEETGFCESDMLKKVVLPEGLKTVFGFNSCHNLSMVELPDGVETIQSFAFSGCHAITSMRIPASVKVVDGSCFAGCNIASFEMDANNPYYVVVDGVIFSKDLTVLVAFPSAFPGKHYVVPETTKIIAFAAFMDSRLESVKLPDGLAEIGEWAFDGSLIRCINMPGTVVSVGRGAFRFCLNLEDVKLSTGLENLPAQLFSSCPKLKVLDVPSNVRSVCYSAMAWCDGLEVLKLHDGIEEIVDEGPMLGVIGNLRHVNLPATLRKVPGGVFNYSPYINVFNLDSANPFFRIIEDALCSKDGKRLYSVPGYNRTVYNVPDGIEVIEERAFAFLSELQSVKLPSTLKVIKSRAFQGCGSLNYMEIPAGVEWIDINALWADNLKTIVMEGAEPPRMTGYLKDEDYRYRDVDLYVPCEAVWKYRSAPGWKCFAVKGRKDG